MLCCAAIVFVLGVGREVWFRLPGTSRPAEVGFAPVATRPAPGTAVLAHPRRRDPVTPARPARSRGHAAMALGMLAVGTLVYGLSIYALLIVGIATPLSTSFADWLLRDLILGLLVVAAAFGATRLRRRARPMAEHHVRGLVLLGLGTAWWALGIADMHVFDLIQVAHGSFFWDVVFHGAGAALIAVGAALYATTARGLPARPPAMEMSERGH